jgi:type IV pilus assembly protein PilA
MDRSRLSQGAGLRRSKQRGFSLIELLIVIGIILVILSIALPQMGKSQMHAHEMAAIKTLQTINSVEVQYQSTYGQYATSLAQLGPPAGSQAAEGPQAANLISGNLASGDASGYKFTVTATPSGYSVVAVPKVFNSTGRRSFYTDQTGIIRESSTQEAANANSPELKSN